MNIRSRSVRYGFSLSKSLAVLVALTSPMLSSDAISQENEDASGDVEDFDDLALEDLLGLETTVATLRPTTSRESPGIITVVTAEEIRAMGARDMIDVLQFVPGFAFGLDVQSVIGVGVRGNWGHEGKVLLLIDGVEMNENLFGTLQFSNHYPVDAIERIEIIRGPGSVIYGGYAELAVINIITKKGADLLGMGYRVSYGHRLDNDGTSGFGRWSMGLSHGYFEPVSGAEYSVHLNAGQGNLSVRPFTDFWGDSYDMGNGSTSQDPFNLAVNLRYRELKMNAVIDRYSTMQQDGFDEILRRAVHNDFITYGFNISYAARPVDKLTITPLFSYKYQEPWNSTGNRSRRQGWYYDKVTQRIKGGLTIGWDATSWLNLVVGGEYFHDRGQVKGTREEKEIAVLFNVSGNRTALLILGECLQGGSEGVVGEVLFPESGGEQVEVGGGVG